MIKFIVRLLEILKRVGIVQETYNFTHFGRGVSLNQYYSQQHWTQRARIKKEYSALAEVFISKELDDSILINEFMMIIFYNSKHDPDNVSGFEKVVMDRLKERGNIIDDSKKYYKLFCVIPDESLSHNQFVFKLIKLK